MSWPEEAKRMPCVTQKEGTMQQIKRKQSPNNIVKGVICRKYTITGRRPPDAKWKTRVNICEFISDAKRKDHT